MQLQLADKEHDILAWALKSAIGDLGHEIADTPTPSGAEPTGA